MNGIKLILRAVHHGEQHLVRELVAVAERHHTEHEIHHVATDLAGWSREHLQQVSDTARDYDLALTGPPDASSSGFLMTLTEQAAERAGCRPEPGLLLLRDLRELHLSASNNSLHWEMLAQAAQATKDDKLLELASACHPQTLRQMRWANTMIKILCPQILTSL
ncbi:hypothetical protein OHA45_01290 [Streptomyces lydicus]|uniref:hypothetical protein n=1 Tax=Streptomyces lydicus TaxID=47763 RepID=UPI002E2FB3D4|nr:hypothetical protein [Streptomyces lydicus]